MGKFRENHRDKPEEKQDSGEFNESRKERRAKLAEALNIEPICEADTKACPRCGWHGFSEEEGICSFCGYSLPDPDYPDIDEYGRRGRWEEFSNLCPNCSEVYKNESDDYCRYCGKKRTGEKVRLFVLSPLYNDMQDMYGPQPATLDYFCPKCGYNWNGSNWDRQSFCPKCGSKVRVSGGLEDHYELQAITDEVEILENYEKQKRNLQGIF